MRTISLVKKFSFVLLISIVLFGFTLGKVISSSMRQNMITRSNEITANFLQHEIYSQLEIKQLLSKDTAYYNRIVWLSILIGSILLYMLLFGLFWRASRRIELQNQEIHLSEERFRNLIQSAQEGIVSADKSGKIVLMNETAELIFGYTVEEAKTRHFATLFLPEKNVELQEHLDRFFTDGACCAIGKNFESAGPRKDGETFPLEVSLSVSGKKDNCMLTGLIIDITQRNQL